MVSYCEPLLGFPVYGVEDLEPAVGISKVEELEKVREVVKVKSYKSDGSEKGGTWE